MTHQPYNNRSFKDECDHLGSKAFSVIELVEVSGINPKSFEIIRKKLINLGNDIKRLAEKKDATPENKFVLMMPLIKDGE